MEQKEDYNVIWIDDEWDTIGKAFIQICEKRHKIHIKPFKTRREGMDALERNLKFWDGVILDAKAFNNSSINEVADVDALYEAIRQIERLKAKRHIPYFVLTRQPDLMDDRMFEKSVGKFYKKDAEGQSKLIADLKEEVGNTPRHQLKMQYNDVMERLYSLDIEAGEDVLNILEAMHHPNQHPDFEPVNYYNKLRKILEWNFREANKYGIIPDECIEDGVVNLNQSCCYLSGLNCDHIHLRYGDETKKERIVPKHIKDMMFLVLYLGNIKSHTAKLPKDDINRLERYLKDEVKNSRYLIFSLALQTCEITMWLGRYMDEHPNKEENLEKCTKLEVPYQEKKENNIEMCGVIELHDGVYHIGSSICLNPIFVKQQNWLGKKVKIVKYGENTNDKTKDRYPYFASNIQLIEETGNGSK